MVTLFKCRPEFNNYIHDVRRFFIKPQPKKKTFDKIRDGPNSHIVYQYNDKPFNSLRLQVSKFKILGELMGAEYMIVHHKIEFFAKVEFE